VQQVLMTKDKALHKAFDRLLLNSAGLCRNAIDNLIDRLNDWIKHAVFWFAFKGFDPIPIGQKI
jgi:hypothetical protein